MTHIKGVFFKIICATVIANVINIKLGKYTQKAAYLLFSFIFSSIQMYFLNEFDLFSDTFMTGYVPQV